MPAAVLDALGVFDIFRVAEAAKYLPGQDLGKPDDRVERRPQLMRHRRKKSTLRLAHRLRLASRLVEALLPLLDVADVAEQEKKAAVLCGAAADPQPAAV